MWCSHSDATSMSLTSTSSSWPRSKVVVRTSSGSCHCPARISWYARATRAGVSRRPSRSGSSPTASSSSRMASSARFWSKAPTVARPSTVTGSIMVILVFRENGAAPRVEPWGPRSAFRLRSGVRSVLRAALVLRQLRQLHGGRPQLRGGAVGQRQLLGRLHRRPGGRRAARGARPGGARRALHHGGEDLRQLLLVEGLLLQQREDQVVQHVAVLDQDLPRLVVGVLDQLLDLFVHQGGDLFRVVALVAHLTA